MLQIVVSGVIIKKYAEDKSCKYNLSLINIKFAIILNFKIMKKIILAVAAVLLFLGPLTAQEQALGLRLGSGSAFGGEISYQKFIADQKRIELDLGFIGNENYNGVALTGIHQWVWDLDDLGDGFAWYAGVGAGIRVFNGIGAGINGQIGIEYKFEGIPIQLSIDARPGWYVGNANGFGYGAALGVRYVF